MRPVTRNETWNVRMSLSSEKATPITQTKTTANKKYANKYIDKKKKRNKPKANFNLKSNLNFNLNFYFNSSLKKWHRKRRRRIDTNCTTVVLHDIHSSKPIHFNLNFSSNIIQSRHFLVEWCTTANQSNQTFSNIKNTNEAEEICWRQCQLHCNTFISWIAIWPEVHSPRVQQLHVKTI